MKSWVGRRVIKTGMAVFITAFICHLIELPPTFAVITAIVTTEPTAADSIKKGLIRLPAAALGAIFAIAADFVFGQNALTYALVAMLTIIVCSKLRLDTGTLVATLTAVAMIPGTTDHAFIDFITRISSTSIGIFVSTFVNFFLLPPRFGPILSKRVDYLFAHSGTSLQSIIEEHLSGSIKDRTIFYRQLQNDLMKASELIQFQHDEWKYRDSCEFERRSFNYLQKKLDYLHFILFHIGKLSYIRLNQTLSDSEQNLLHQIGQSFSAILKDPYHQVTTYHYTQIELIKQQKLKYPHSDTFINQICHELLSLQKIISELTEVTSDERRFSIEEEKYPTYIFKKEAISE
ncbi:FUSC family protein [Bacillus suaedae]|uniref:Aromatic acid exporter family protein n=1 Tax=Halalkalibacter suaedae TaxID=2822140 RepID=A0A940X014_9BACI|nr:aromatic acid exporter family protein [Bacillus suaedae]MBP3952185.1 aromatic acid exporter family protein [Bacillus suaedae]